MNSLRNCINREENTSVKRGNFVASRLELKSLNLKMQNININFYGIMSYDCLENDISL